MTYRHARQHILLPSQPGGVATCGFTEAICVMSALEMKPSPLMIDVAGLNPAQQIFCGAIFLKHGGAHCCDKVSSRDVTLHVSLEGGIRVSISAPAFIFLS